MRARNVDGEILARTARRIGIQAAALVGVVVIALAGLAGAVVLRGQHAAAATLLHDTVNRADDVNDPPAGVWLTLRQAGVDVSSPKLPPGLPDDSSLTAVGVSGRPREVDLHVGEREFRVLTVSRGGVVVQAALDLRTEHAERDRLLRALAAGGGLGLLLAVVSGTVLGRRAVAPLSEVLRLQRQFVADASHELRTPLTLLSTRAQLLERGLARADVHVDLRRDAAGVVADARRLGSVVDDLLVAADPRPVTEPVDLDELCQQVSASTAPYAAERGVTLNVGAPIGSSTVDGQPAALRRALLALVQNAIEHSPRGGTVRLGCDAQDAGRLHLTVEDEGPGLDPGRRGELLSRFHSGGHDTNRRHYGLGLALADEVAARHGGRLDFRTPAEGPGTVFSLTLPRARSESR